MAAIARRYGFVRETGGANLGAWVEMFQRFCGGVPGESWCADFESVIEDICYKGKNQTPRSGSCQVKLEFARKKGWVVATPLPDDVFFYVNDVGHAHHIGIVTVASPLTGIAGNTSEDGTSSNGTGVFEHTLNVAPNKIVFVRLPR